MWGVVLVDVCRVLVLFCFCVVCVCCVWCGVCVCVRVRAFVSVVCCARSAVVFAIVSVCVFARAGAFMYPSVRVCVCALVREVSL